MSFGSGWGDEPGQLAFFTSRTEVESVLSTVGLDLRVDDDLDGVVSTAEEDYLVDAMAEATDEVAGYLLHRYEHSELENSRWVRRVTSYFAASAICRRHGNPDMFVTELERYQKKMEDVIAGKFFIPNANSRVMIGPKMSNIVVDNNYANNKVRVDKQSSVGDEAPDRHADQGLYYSDWAKK